MRTILHQLIKDDARETTKMVNAFVPLILAPYTQLFKMINPKD